MHAVAHAMQMQVHMKGARAGARRAGGQSRNSTHLPPGGSAGVRISAFRTRLAALAALAGWVPAGSSRCLCSSASKRGADSGLSWVANAISKPSYSARCKAEVGAGRGQVTARVQGAEGQPQEHNVDFFLRVSNCRPPRHPSYLQAVLRRKGARILQGTAQRAQGVGRAGP